MASSAAGTGWGRESPRHNRERSRSPNKMSKAERMAKEREALSQSLRDIAENEQRAFRGDSPRSPKSPKRAAQTGRKAAESPPPDNALTESPDDSPSSAGAEAALGWMRDTVSAVSGQASPASPSQREAHVPSEGPNTNSWVYERAELMDRLKKESSMRAKAEEIAASFIKEKETAEALRAQAERELAALRGSHTAEAAAEPMATLKQQVLLLEKKNQKQMSMIEDLKAQVATLKCERSTDEAHGNQAILTLKRQLSDATAELTRANSALRGEKQSLALANDQLDESRRKLGEKERQIRELESKLKRSQSAEKVAQARNLQHQQENRAVTPSPTRGNRKASSPSPRRSRTPGPNGARGPDPALQDLVAWQVTFSQVASQLRSSTQMPIGPETDAYVAMLCKKAEKMNEKLMNETPSPETSPGLHRDS